MLTQVTLCLLEAGDGTHGPCVSSTPLRGYEVDMSEKTKARELGRFNPLRSFMRVQRYAQNSPRAYGFWVGLASAGVGVALIIGFCLPVILANGNPLGFWRVHLVALVMLLVVSAVGAWALSRFVRWVTKEGAIPRDADPSRLWAAQRLWRTGKVSGDPETDRLARVIVAQANKGNSSRTLAVLVPLSAAPLGVLVVDEMLRGIPVNPFLGAILVFVLVVWAIALPLLLRQRRKGREFQEAYDARYGGFDEARNGPEGATGEGRPRGEGLDDPARP